jgi:hypothetical protein
LVVVGDLSSESALRERALIGETPNLAGRLQALAEPGAIVVAASTRRLLGDLFRLRDLGRHEVKGIAEPIAAWAVDDPEAGIELMRNAIGATEANTELNRRTQTRKVNHAELWNRRLRHTKPRYPADGVRYCPAVHESVHGRHECDLRAAPINVRSWESNGLNADVTFGPFMTPSGHSRD